MTAVLERRKRRTPHEIAAETALDHWAVAVIGWPKRYPRTWGDNIGWWGCKVIVTKDLRQYFAGQDLGPIEVVPHAYVWTLGRAWADRLRDAVNAEIKRQAAHMRRNWYDLDPAVAELVLRMVAKDQGIEVFDQAEHMRRIAAAIEAPIRAIREGRR